jgi:protein-S-isoprenylcysteine O-methyltransferase Ste14
MSAPSTTGKAEGKDAIRATAIIRFAIFAIFVLITPLALFVPANTLKWGMAWAYTALVVVGTLVSRIVVALVHPDLLAERARSMDAEDVKPWDKIIVPIIAIYGPLAACVVAGLDFRKGWTTAEISPAAQWGALAAVALGYVIGSWAMAVNKFFSGYVRIQEERGHTVVSGGPYRVVRHPGYASSVIAYLATPVALGSLWAYIPLGLVVLLLFVRTALEDRTLQEELPGYAEYAQQTRFRLVPGVW